MSITDFMETATKLKQIKRTGWIESGVEDPESVADHSYMTALLSMILSDAKGLDTLRVLRMALIHDLSEVTIGDLTPRQKKKNHIEMESDAMMSTLSQLPEAQKRTYIETWSEYQENVTPEARLVHNADKLEMLFQAREYEKTGVNLDQFWETSIEKEYTEYKPERN